MQHFKLHQDFTASVMLSVPGFLVLVPELWLFSKSHLKAVPKFFLTGDKSMAFVHLSIISLFVIYSLFDTVS